MLTWFSSLNIFMAISSSAARRRPDDRIGAPRRHDDGSASQEQGLPARADGAARPLKLRPEESTRRKDPAGSNLRPDPGMVRRILARARFGADLAWYAVCSVGNRRPTALMLTHSQP